MRCEAGVRQVACSVRTRSRERLKRVVDLFVSFYCKQKRNFELNFHRQHVQDAHFESGCCFRQGKPTHNSVISNKTIRMLCACYCLVGVTIIISRVVLLNFKDYLTVSLKTTLLCLPKEVFGIHSQLIVYVELEYTLHKKIY